jgi:hypothetical protein
MLGSSTGMVSHRSGKPSSETMHEQTATMRNDELRSQPDFHRPDNAGENHGANHRAEAR